MEMMLIMMKMRMMRMMMIMRMTRMMRMMMMMRITNLLIHLGEQVLLVFKLPKHSLKKSIRASAFAQHFCSPQFKRLY